MEMLRHSATVAEPKGRQTEVYTAINGHPAAEIAVSQRSVTPPSGNVSEIGPSDTARHRGSWRHFLRHVAEMVIAMMVGMPVGVGIFSAIVGENYKASRHDYPTAALLVMAISMTIPMVAWMRLRRHSWRNSVEMGMAMMLPAVPFLAEVWDHSGRDAPTGPYMTVSTLAMIALMLFRWNVYSTHPPRRSVR